MADRYAAQRSRKENRRRALPRLSDPVPAVLEEHDSDESPVAPDSDGEAEAEGAPAATATLTRRPTVATIPRRPTPINRRNVVAPAPTVTRVDYHYVVSDLKRIAMTAVVMLVLLIVLNIALRAAIQVH